MNMQTALTLFVVGGIAISARAHAEWAVILPKTYLEEEAIRVAVDDLVVAGRARGIQIVVWDETAHFSSYNFYIHI